MITLAIFGATGSIGKSSLKIFNKNKKQIKLMYLSANTDYRSLKNLQKKYNPKNILLTDKKLNKKLSQSDNSIILENNLFKKKKIDYVISGVSGYESLDFNFNLLKISKNLLLANKETIICGGKIFKQEAKKQKCNIIPIDSEHYCIDFFLKNFCFNGQHLFDEIYIVASGGPFLNKKITNSISLKNTLKHPTWKMGKINTINSSTLANKVLEMFEAKKFFDIESSKIKMIIEPTSNAHVIFKLKNNLIFPIIHHPTMELPISNSMGLINNFSKPVESINLKLKKINFNKFPIAKIGYKILNNYSDSGMILFTIFNQRLVDKYLNNEINYVQISKKLLRLFSNKTIINKSKLKMNCKKQIFSIIKFAQKIKL